VVLEGLEKETRDENNGLWADLQPVPPWEWWERTLEAANGVEPRAESSEMIKAPASP
jgi:hypothetical protein